MLSRTRIGLGCLIMLFAMVQLAACGGGGNGASPLPMRQAAGFELRVLPESLLEGTAADSFNLAARESVAGAEVDVIATGAVNLRALYFTLDYDAGRYRPLEVALAGRLGEAAELLRLDVLDEPGRVHSGAVRMHCDACAGFSGDGVLATVRFGPGPAPAARAAASVPISIQSKATLLGNDSTGELSWRYFNQGDYNMDKLVYVSDLTPLGQNYLAEGPFDANSALHAVDGNGDGMITVNDITQIGQNYNNRVEAFYVYGSTDPLDYPPGADLPNGDGAVLQGSVVFEDRQPVDGERHLFTYTVAAPVSGAQYWIRPNDGETDGIASTTHTFSSAAVVFDVADALEGGGTAADPYVVGNDETVQFVVTHPLQGDVTTSEDTELTISDEQYGAIDPLTGIMTLDDDAAGAFHVSATYDAAATLPDQLHFRLLDATVPVLTFLNAPDTGTGIEIDPYIVYVDTTYIFQLFSLLYGNIAGDALTTWTLSDPLAGDVVKGATQATINIDGGYAGIFSVGAQYDGELSWPAQIYLRAPGDAPLLSLANPPAEGAGEMLDPYIARYTVGSPPAFTFSLIDSTDGDVSTDALASWSVSEAEAGSFAAGTSDFSLTDGYIGFFYIGAEYDGKLSLPQALWIDATLMNPTTPPVADINALPATSDVTPVEVTLDAGGSTDEDGTIVSYDWDFEGDGEWDIEDDDEATIDHWYAGTGVYNATVRVHDNDGAIDTASVEVRVTDEGNFWPTAELIADSTGGEVPLTVNFDASGSSDPETAALHFWWDLDGDGAYETDGGTTPTTSHEYTEAGHIWPSVKVYDDSAAWDYAEVELTLTAGGNLPPEAVLSAAPTYINPPPQTVDFDASDSLDEDGTIVQYRWDFDGDAAYDETGAVPTSYYEYTTAGIYDAVVEVTDNDGATDTDTVKVTVVADGASWHIVPVVAPDGTDILKAGRCNTLKVVDGYPAIAYQDTHSGAEYDKSRPMYVRATDADGLAWGTPVLVRDPTWEQEISGIDIDLEIIDGRPAVCFAEREWVGSWTYNLYFERAEDATGADWSAGSVGVDDGSGEMRGTYCDLALAGGNPAISYHDMSNHQLRYCAATAADGSAWGASQMLDDASGVTSGSSAGEFSSLCIVDGNPAVSYLVRVSDVSAGHHLRFIRAANAAGTAWGSPQSLDVAQSLAQGTSMILLAGGMPAIAYADVVNDRVQFIAATAADGSAWESPVTACATSNDFGATCPSLALLGGMPVLGLYDTSMFGADLKFARATDAGGTTWQSAETVASPGDGLDTSVWNVNGKPALSFYNEGEMALYYAVYY